MSTIEFVYLIWSLYGLRVLMALNTANKQWWKYTQIYEIYIRSFKDSNGDGIGDLRGMLD